MRYIQNPLAFDHILWNMGGGGHSTTTTTQELSPEQRALLDPVIPIARNFLANPPTQYPGSGIAGFNPLQTSAQQMTLNAANSMLGPLGQIPGQINTLNQGWGDLRNAFGTNAGGFGNTAAALGGNAGSFGANANAFGANAGRFGAVPQYGNAAIGAANQGVSGAGNIQDQIMSMIRGVSGGTDFLTSGRVLNANSNPYLQSAITAATRPVTQQFNEQILPGLTQDSLGMGGLGGTRQGIAEGLAARGANQTMADMAASMSNTNYQAGLQAMLGGLQAAQGQRGDVLAGGNLAQNAAAQLAQTMLGGGQLANQALTGQTQALAGQTGALQGQTGALQGQTQALAGQTNALTGQGQALQGSQNLLGNIGQILQQTLLPAQLQEAVGAQQQMMTQQQLSEQIQRFVNQQMIPFSAAQDVAAMAFGMPGGTTRSESTGGPNQGGQMMGSIMGSVIPMMLGKLSDRRLKKDIKAVGREKGLTLYSFKYRGTSLSMIGFMADEVEKLYPELVFTYAAGYKGVNYGELRWLNS